ncbi:MAG: hypothetical protein VXW25_02280, partial [Pseudomonadota bacterium]|nr:hypothetical protein [Pseudomonadota bacterium]
DIEMWSAHTQQMTAQLQRVSRQQAEQRHAWMEERRGIEAHWQQLVRCGRLDMLAAEMAANRPKGEIVLVVGGRPDTDEEVDDATLDAMLHAEMDGQRLRDAVRAVVEATGLPRNRVYRAALALDATNDRT